MSWSKTPPTEPGWYWVRVPSSDWKSPHRLTAEWLRMWGDETRRSHTSMARWEFWLVPIQPPTDDPHP